MATTQPRSYAAAHFGFQLDGKDEVGLFKSIEGGNIKCDVMSYQNGTGFDRWRQLGKPKFEDIKLQVGMSMSQPFYTWISDFLARKVVRKTGAIIAADFYFVERARREFSEALIKEIAFPKLDGQDKNPVYMNVTMAVEDMKFLPGSNQTVKGLNKAQDPKIKVTGFDAQKLWTSNNFRFSLDKFPNECKRVSKIDAFTIKQNILEYHAGPFRNRAPIKAPSQVEFPNLTFYVPEVDGDKFLEHFRKRGVMGEIPGRMTGMIQCLNPNLKPLCTMSFAGADIFSVTPEKADSGSEEIKQLKIELYVESMKFEYHNPGVQK